MAFIRDINLSRDERSFVATHVLATNVYAPIVFLHPRDSCYHGLFVSNDEAWMLGTTKFFELLDALVVSCTYAKHHQSSDLAALLQQFAFYSLVVFQVFFSFFRRLPRNLHVTRSHTLHHPDISIMS